MIQDHHRPIYHHLPNEGLLWDPCAAVFRDGRYHLFYLHDSWSAAGFGRSALTTPATLRRPRSRVVRKVSKYVISYLRELRTELTPASARRASQAKPR